MKPIDTLVADLLEERGTPLFARDLQTAGAIIPAGVAYAQGFAIDGWRVVDYRRKVAYNLVIGSREDADLLICGWCSFVDKYGNDTGARAVEIPEDNLGTMRQMLRGMEREYRSSWEFQCMGGYTLLSLFVMVGIGVWLHPIIIQPLLVNLEETGSFWAAPALLGLCALWALLLLGLAKVVTKLHVFLRQEKDPVLRKIRTLYALY